MPTGCGRCALAALAPQLSGEAKAAALDAALAAARAIKFEKDRAKALAALAPQLSGEAKAAALDAGLAAARAIKFEKDRAKALAALAPQLSTTQLDEALAAARAGFATNRVVRIAQLASGIGSEDSPSGDPAMPPLHAGIKTHAGDPWILERGATGL